MMELVLHVIQFCASCVSDSNALPPAIGALTGAAAGPAGSVVSTPEMTAMFLARYWTQDPLIRRLRRGRTIRPRRLIPRPRTHRHRKIHPRRRRHR